MVAVVPLPLLLVACGAPALAEVLGALDAARLDPVVFEGRYER